MATTASQKKLFRTLTILHVEDDELLADAVQQSFKSFGFEGTMLTAMNVTDAQELLAAIVGRGDFVDLILSDMRLPDGSGLDIIRAVRAIPQLANVPILMLSGDIDPRAVGRAYALGANCFVNKMPAGRRLDAVIKTLHDHWLKDVKLPMSPHHGRTQRVLMRSITLRERHAEIYMRVAEQLAERSPMKAQFWLERSVTQSNLGNLISFLARQAVGAELPKALLDTFEEAQATFDSVVLRLEDALDERPVGATEVAMRLMLELAELTSGDAFAELVSRLFPLSTVAMPAVRDAIAADLESAIAFIESHSQDPVMRARAAQLRDDGERIRALPEPIP